MKKYLKLLVGACLAFTATDLRANIYRINLSYGNDLSADGAGLTGYFLINPSLDTDNELTTDNPSGWTLFDNGTGGLPTWITAVELTFDPTPLDTTNGDEVVSTKSSFQAIRWDLKTDGVFDYTNDFVGQMDGLGFVSTLGDGKYSIGTGSFQQNYDGFNTVLSRNSQSEFVLNSTTTTPGELPLLGFGALIFYFKKLKSKNFKL